jgi:hypothetical protein
MSIGKKGFQKGNDYSFKPNGTCPLDPKPLAIKLRTGQIAKLKAIPNWQGRLRDLIDMMIENEEHTISD